MFLHVYKHSGHTFIEFIVAVAILVLAIGGAIAVYVMTTTIWKEGSAQVAIQREARITMEKMVRGIDGRNGIREAQQVTLPAIGASSTRINFADADDSNLTRSFYFSAGADNDYDTVADNQLRYIDENDTDTPIIQNNVRTLTFNQQSAGFVTITLGLQDNVRSKVINVDLSTQVKLRNSED